MAYAQGQASLKLAAVEFAKTLFESAEYAARNRTDHWYVYDLYKTFLMREPDASGWAYWESVTPGNGRVNVRRAFEEAPEFAGVLASITPNGSATANAASLITARVDARNQPGRGMLSRDAAWSVPLLSLPGRNGLDLGLASVVFLTGVDPLRSVSALRRRQRLSQSRLSPRLPQRAAPRV